MSEPRGIYFEILVNDPDLGIIVRATDLDTGATGLGAGDPGKPLLLSDGYTNGHTWTYWPIPKDPD